MKFISYEIRLVADFGDCVYPVSDYITNKTPIEQFWSLYGRTPADKKGRCLIGQVWNATTYADIRQLYQRLTGCDLPETEQDYFDLPVDPPKVRTEPDYLTAGFLAIGAHDEFKRQTAAGSSYILQDGYLGYIDSVVKHGLFLDKVADYIDKHGEHPGCWCYEVAEEFGAKFGEQVLLDCDSSKSAEILLREIMIECGYDEDMLVEAFKRV